MLYTRPFIPEGSRQEGRRQFLTGRVRTTSNKGIGTPACHTAALGRRQREHKQIVGGAGGWLGAQAGMLGCPCAGACWRAEPGRPEWISSVES